jgi:hypothetical protein
MFESYQANLYLAVSILASLGLIIAHSVRLAPVRISARFVCVAVLGGFLLGGAGTRLVSKTFSLAVPKNANAEIAYAREAIRTGKCDPGREIVVAVVGSSKTNVHIRADDLEAYLEDSGIPACVLVFAEGGSNRFERRDYVETAIVDFSIPIDVIFFEATSTHHRYLVKDPAFLRNSESLRIRDIDVWPMYKELFLWAFTNQDDGKRSSNQKPAQALLALLRIHAHQILNLGRFHSVRPIVELERRVKGNGAGAGGCAKQDTSLDEKLERIISALERQDGAVFRNEIFEAFYRDLEVAISRAAPESELIYFTTPTNSPRASGLDEAFCTNGPLKERCRITPSAALYKQLASINRWSDTNHVCPEMLPIYTAWYYGEIAQQLRELWNQRTFAKRGLNAGQD